MAGCLLIFVIVMSGNGCGSTPHALLKAPPRPIFYPYDDFLWNQIPKQAQDAISSDDLACKQYVKRVEARITIHNGKEE